MQLKAQIGTTMKTWIKFHKIREKYILNLKKLSNKRFITDKLPGNFKRIGFIVNVFLMQKSYIYRETNGCLLVKF